MKQWSLRYAILKNALLFGFHRFYRNVEILGLDNIPDKEAVIFAENHTNAVLDPILTAVFHNRQPGFLTRSDVFKNSLLDKIFRGFKMIPVYRQRDGVNTRVANKPIFDAVVAHLKEGGAIVIAPEGDKGIDHHLLPLKKGGSRMAVQLMEEMYWKKPLYFLPVGITYGNYMSHRGDLVVRYGKPFLVNDFKEDFEKDPDKIFTIITNRLAEEIKGLTWNVEDEDQLDWFYKLKKLDGVAPKLSERMDWAYDKLPDIVSLSSEEQMNLMTIFDKYLQSLEERKLDDRDVKNAARGNKWNALGVSVILLPFTILNVILHGLPVQLSYLFVRKMKMHPHFQTSILYGFKFLLFPLFYLIYFILILSLTHSLITSIFIILVGPMIALISREWHKNWRVFVIPKHLVQKRKLLLEHLGKI